MHGVLKPTTDNDIDVVQIVHAYVQLSFLSNPCMNIKNDPAFYFVLIPFILPIKLIKGQRKINFPDTTYINIKEHNAILHSVKIREKQSLTYMHDRSFYLSFGGWNVIYRFLGLFITVFTLVFNKRIRLRFNACRHHIEVH